MISLFLRPLFVLVTLALLVMAFFQVSGRLMFSALSELEGGVNQWLQAQHTVLSGLSGSWRRINPVVSIDHIELPAGHLTGVRVEVDWIESLVRNRIVARRAVLEGGRILLERRDGGWRLAGAQGGADFNPFDTIYHSDALELSLSVGFIGESGHADPADDLDVIYRATNRGGQHRHRLHIANAVCLDECALELALDESEAIVFVRPQAIEARVNGSGLKVPTPLLGREGGRLATASASWWRDDLQSGGKGLLDFGGIGITNGDPVHGRLEVAVRGDGEIHHMELTGARLTNGAASWQLPRFLMTYQNGLLEAWTARIETGPGFQFLAALAPEDTAVYRWLNALRVQATALNVHGFVELPEFETGYLATVQDVALDGYNGAPWLRGGAGELLGANRIMQLQLNTEDLEVQFADVFHQRWVMDHLSGRLQAFISRDYFGFRGTNLRAELDGSLASGGFALSRPQDRYRERLTLLVNVDQTTVARGKQYIPYRLPAGLPEWLEDGPRAGNLTQVALAYHGQIHTRPFELARRVEFAAGITDGHIQYHPDWPVVTDLSGQIGVAGRDVRIEVDEGYSLSGTDLAGSRIRLRDNASFADIDLVSESSVDEALMFIRRTPLAEWMAFVTPDWAGSGPLKMTGRLVVPLKLSGEHIGERSPDDGLAVDLDIELASADLDLPGYGVALGDLVGDIHYTYPYGISGSAVRGRIFDRPAVFGASSDEDTVVFHVNGHAPYEDVLVLLDVADPGVIRGGFDFIADLHIELADAVSRLDVVSDLTGLALDFPAEFAKTPDDSVPTELELRFLDRYQSVRFRYGAAQGWLHVNEQPLRGAIGFSGLPPLVETSANELVLGGRIDGFSVDQVIPDGDAGPSLSIPLVLAGLEVGLIDVNGIGFEDVVLSGRIGAASSISDDLESEVGPSTIDIAVESNDLTGTLKLAGDDPMVLDLSMLRLPESKTEGGDPLNAQIVPELLDADITLGQLFVGETDYGSWTFKLRPGEQGLALENLSAVLRGVSIEANELFWDTTSDRTHFEGRMQAGDLAEVLPMWGYVASVTTERATMSADLSWRGSPAAVDLELLVGRASFEAETGRFLEVTSGADAMKIFSLVNFSTIAKRLNFDFSDVVGEGVSFDSLTATTDFEEGTMRFAEPMAVKGSGSNFRIAGTVDLIEGQLDNEMIVTLPVTKGLPWYAAYVALANPLAGLGVLVGERVLRKPLEQFSSAKYQITGTLEDPELKFVSVWDTSMDQPQVGLEGLDPEAVEPDATTGDESPGAAGEREPPEEAAMQNTGSTTG